jgi:nicotinate-nucleotide adenylyltransferase
LNIQPAIGILGGTFDPIHFGHLRLAEEMRARFGLGQVNFIPAGDPYQKSGGDAARRRVITPAADRLQMVRIGIRGNAGFFADDREMRRNGPSFSFDTLHGLRAEFGADAALVWLMGSDTFLGMPTWHRWNELFDFAHIAIAERAGNSGWRNAMAEPLLDQFEQRLSSRESELATQRAGRIAVVSMTALDISSSAIRAQLKTGASPRYLVPDGVLDYIEQHQLYPREGDGHP